TGKDGNDYRVATVPVVAHGLAVMIGYPIQSLERSLAFLRLMLILVGLGGVALAAMLGWAVGRASMGPVENLTLAAEHVAETQDLSAHIDDTGNDELGRLARSFNAMLAALSASRHQQAQLVSDAGHELRTPLTSLRTNIEVLMRARDLPDADRNELLEDVKAQLEELTTLVGDLVDLAREEERPVSAWGPSQAEPELVDVSQIVAKAVERAQRRALSVTFSVHTEPACLKGHAPLLERAVMNVLDNAAKWSPAGGEVVVTTESSDHQRLHISVTDEGPGIAPEDLPRVFDRFYRAQSARSMPGSGLGLAIVKRVVTSHGGDIAIASRPEGGTQVDMWLPRADAEGLGAGQPEDL
ncbi:MAG TPA: HAMP domain-containing sensor histidine kinase, partial [Acidimicrobiales bacterium]|nr:HAMP domain-containing sensor histidine kinase [Acidimicrobiales bacterium]